MQQFIVSVYPDLSEPASTRQLDGTLDVASYAVGGMELQMPDGIEYHLQLTNTGEGVVLAGEVSCKAITPCARCLKPTAVTIKGTVEGYYLLETEHEAEGYESDEFECIESNGTFDIASALEAALVYATPYVVLCKEDCAGLCPHCGADLNNGPCSCDEDEEDDSPHPFAALKDFDFDKK